MKVIKSVVVANGSYDWEGDWLFNYFYFYFIIYELYVGGFIKYESFGVDDKLWGIYWGFIEKIFYL